MFDNHCEDGHQRIGYDDSESGKCPLCTAMTLLVEAGTLLRNRRQPIEKPTDDIIGSGDPLRR